MQAGKHQLLFFIKIRQPAAVLLYCLLFLSHRPPQDPPPELPAATEDQLRQYRGKDDLTGWIYCQIQWVAKAPATRAGRLVRAAGAAWRSPRSNEEIQAWQDLLINEGYSLLMSGDIMHSTDAYTAAFQWARQHGELADEALVLENILKPLGNNYTRLGDYEQALFIHRKALTIAASLKDKEELAGTYSNLANTASNMGLPAQSLDYCRQGLQMADSHSALRGLLLSEQADACEQLRQPAAARESIQKSIVVLERAIAVPEKAKGGSPDAGYWLLMAYQQAGDIYSLQPAISLKFYHKALALQTRLLQERGSIRKRERAKLFQRLGSLYFRTGQPAKAGDWLDQCLSVLIPGKKIDSLDEADLYAENTLLDLLFTGAGLHSAQDHPDKALYLYELCFAVEKKLRNELVTGSSKEKSVSDSRQRYETAIHTAWDAWQRTGQNKYRKFILEFMESSKSRLLLEEVLQQQQYQPASRPGDSLEIRIRLLERALTYYRKEALQSGNNDSLAKARTMQEKQIEWDLAELRKKTRAGAALSATSASAITRSPAGDGSLAPQATQTMSFSPDSLQAILGHEQSARSFFVGSQALYTIELNRSGISFAERLAFPGQWQDSIRKFIHAYFEEGANNMINHPGAYYRQAYTIYRQLFGRHPLQPGKEYILLPDGVLSLLPVEALVTEPGSPPSPEKGSFVIKQALISYAWSLLTLREQVLTPGNSNGFSGFFLSGNRNNGKLPLLQAIASEKEGVSRTIKKGDWYMDDQATTSAFRRALQGSALVHISSHAFTKKDTLDAPHIELFNEPFYLFELKDLERHPALVVLSACRTGDGRMVTGEGVQSLARAFTANGANAVVAGWWNVNDEAAAQLIQGFYASLVSGQDAAATGQSNVSAEHTAGSGVNAAKALRQSKLNWLNDPHIPYLHKLPYYWAALNYHGNPAPLKAGDWMGDTRKTPAWWLLILVFPVLLLMIRHRR